MKTLEDMLNAFGGAGLVELVAGDAQASQHWKYNPHRQFPQTQLNQLSDIAGVSTSVQVDLTSPSRLYVHRPSDSTSLHSGSALFTKLVLRSKWARTRGRPRGRRIVHSSNLSAGTTRNDCGRATALPAALRQERGAASLIDLEEEDEFSDREAHHIHPFLPVGEWCPVEVHLVVHRLQLDGRGVYGGRYRRHLERHLAKRVRIGPQGNATIVCFCIRVFPGDAGSEFDNGIPIAWIAIYDLSGRNSLSTDLPEQVKDVAFVLAQLAAFARKDYDDRRRRQAQGIAKAKAEGRLKGRPEDSARNASIMAALRGGQTWSQIVDGLGCSRATVAKLAKRLQPV